VGLFEHIARKMVQHGARSAAPRGR
jgi:hypothetical protein